MGLQLVKLRVGKSLKDRIGAAHENRFTREEAKDLVNFTEMLLTYLFTLPGMVKAKKAASE